MSWNARAMMGVGAVVAGLAGMLALAALPVAGGLVFAASVVAAAAAVAFTSQQRRFDDESRLVYRPVYVRTRTVRRRFVSLDD